MSDIISSCLNINIYTLYPIKQYTGYIFSIIRKIYNVWCLSNRALLNCLKSDANGQYIRYIVPYFLPFLCHVFFIVYLQFLYSLYCLFLVVLFFIVTCVTYSLIADNTATFTLAFVIKCSFQFNMLFILFFKLAKNRAV